MAYIVWVSLGGEMEGEYSGIKHDTEEEAKEEERNIVETDGRIVSSWIQEV